MPSPSKGTPPKKHMLADPLVIIRPGKGNTPVRVFSGVPANCAHSCPPGVICASGTWEQVSLEDPDHVYGKVIPAGSPVPGLDPTDPCTAEGDVNADSTWEISGNSSKGADIPCADCGDPPVANTIVVWLTFPSGHIEAKTQDFNGECTDHTECDRAATSPASQLLAKQFLESAPYQLEVRVQDFKAEQARALNAAWTLKLPKGKHGVWSNGGGKKKSPLVELRLDASTTPEWQLLFKVGRFKALYQQSAQNWEWNRANDLLFTGGDPVKKGVPALVRVMPV